MVTTMVTSGENLISISEQEIVGTPIIQQGDRNIFAQIRAVQDKFV